MLQRTLVKLLFLLSRGRVVVNLLKVKRVTEQHPATRHRHIACLKQNQTFLYCLLLQKRARCLSRRCVCLLNRRTSGRNGCRQGLRKLRIAILIHLEKIRVDFLNVLPVRNTALFHGYVPTRQSSRHVSLVLYNFNVACVKIANSAKIRLRDLKTFMKVLPTIITRSCKSSSFCITEVRLPLAWDGNNVLKDTECKSTRMGETGSRLLRQFGSRNLSVRSALVFGSSRRDEQVIH